jgi:hypothetical protein
VTRGRAILSTLSTALLVAAACGGPQKLGASGSTCFRDDDCAAGLICVAPTATDSRRVCSSDPTPLISMVEGPPVMMMGGGAGMAGTAGMGAVAGGATGGADNGGNANAGSDVGGMATAGKGGGGAGGKAGSGGMAGNTAGGTDSGGSGGTAGMAGTAGTAPEAGAPP